MSENKLGVTILSAWHLAITASAIMLWIIVSGVPLWVRVFFGGLCVMASIAWITIIYYVMTGGAD